MSALFPSFFEAILFWVVTLGGLVIVPVILSLAAGSQRQREQKKDRTEPAIAFPRLLLFVMVIPIVIGYARIGVLPRYLFYPGLAIAIVGGAITDWGILSLGRFHSPIVRVVSGHSVIQKGPYRFVRHPMYAGQIPAWIGMGLALQSWVALLFVLVAVGLFYSNRIRVEERFLAAEMGEEYVQYMKRAKRIIPYLL